MDKIYFLSGPLLGATAELIGEEVTLGRTSDNAICMEDESVSDHHALLTHRGSDWVVKDLGSAKGTFVRGDRVLVAALRDGDKLAFGSVEAEFQAAVGKLQLPTTPLMPVAPQVITWPQPPGGGAKTEAASFKSAAMKLVQLAAVVAVLAGGYFAYQKFSRMEPSVDASGPDSAKVAPPSAPAPYASRPSLPAAPQPYTTAAAPLANAPASQPAAVSAAYTQLAMRPKGESAPAVVPEPAAPPAAPVAPAPPPVAAAVPVKAASAATGPMMQQVKLLLAQNKYGDAVSYLDKVIASTTDPTVATELQTPLKQALDAQLLSLQSVKQQWEAQCKPLDDRLKATQDKLDQDNKALTSKKDAEAKIYEVPGGHYRYGYWDGHYYYSRTWVPNTRKGTGDQQAQTAIHELQIKVMLDTQDIKKQTDVVNRYHQQILSLDQQIAPVQARVTQLNAVLNPAPPTAPPPPAAPATPAQSVSATK